MAERPLSPAEFAVQFGLEPVDVEWLMSSYRRGMSEAEVRKEVETLGCTPQEAQRLTNMIIQAITGIPGSSHNTR
jgi:hypothetical protein